MRHVSAGSVELAMRTLAAGGVDKALAGFAKLTAAHLRAPAASALAALKADADPDEAIAWAKALPKKEEITAALLGAALSLVDRDPERVIPLLPLFPQKQTGQSPVLRVAKALIKRDAAPGLEWALENLPPQYLQSIPYMLRDAPSLPAVERLGFLRRFRARMVAEAAPGGAMTAGVDMGNGMLTRAIGAPIPLGDKAEAFEFGVYEFKTEELLFRGYEVHDWSDPKRVLVVSSMSLINNAEEAKLRCETLYNSIEVLKEEELKTTLAKIEDDRFTIGRGENEEEIYRKLVGKSLIRIIPDPANPTTPTTQRFDLCATGQGLYLLKSASLPDEDRVQGFWDIYETENGELLLIISQTNGPEGKWAIGPHISGNIAIGGIEFKVEPLGTMGGSVACGEVNTPK